MILAAANIGDGILRPAYSGVGPKLKTPGRERGGSSMFHPQWIPMNHSFVWRWLSVWGCWSDYSGKFLVLTVSVLPLLPNKTMGPLDVLNPFSVGLMIVLMAGVGFVGYVAIKALGAERGLGLTGLIGGMVSSTAVTLSVSGRARQEPSLSNACALAAILASTVMVVRVALVISAVNRELLKAVAIPLAGLVAGGSVAALRRRRAACAAVGGKRISSQRSRERENNPFPGK